MSGAPFMPLYVGDYLADTVHLNGAESGAYLHLLMCMWRADGSLPNDDAKLARFCKITPQQWDRVRTTVLEFFEVEGDRLTNRRLTKELSAYRVSLSKRQERASKGGVAKALKSNEMGSASSMEQAPVKRANQNQNQNQNHIEKKKTTSSKKPDQKVCPDDWQPTPTHREMWKSWNRQPPEFERELIKFKNYEFASGKSDWDRTFTNWILKADEQTPRPLKRVTFV
jgi:uncharacterized protein YdaU (DUF1376 family)